MDMSTTASDARMSMSMSRSSTSTMSDMAMASSINSSMAMSTGSIMGMNAMAMTFFASSTTPLFSTSWTPSSTGQYAATCIFLIAFAAIFRCLLAIRVRFFSLLAIADSYRSGDWRYQLHRKDDSVQHGWRAREAVLLGMLDVVIAGVGYLLMIAVMTMNVAYFLSVLGGVFVGSMVFGHFLANSALH